MSRSNACYYYNQNKMKTSQKLYLPLKRLIAIFGSIAGVLFCLSLLWWWVLIINLFVTKGHPFFKSIRVGKSGKQFYCVKFRSMKLDADPEMTSLQKNVEDNLTGFGKFLRRTSIDETLQLFNILAGQMAFIGPRPLINVGEDKVTIELRKQNGSINLRPGLSGYAQIHKRGDLDPRNKALYDGIYLENFSLWWDIKIFLYTIFCILGTAKGR